MKEIKYMLERNFHSVYVSPKCIYVQGYGCTLAKYVHGCFSRLTKLYYCVPLVSTVIIQHIITIQNCAWLRLDPVKKQ